MPNTSYNARVLPFLGSILFLASLFACRSNALVKSDALASKSAPYDHFSQQRAWPDLAFDWSAWRQQMQDIKAAENTAAKGDPCQGNATKWTLQGPSNVAGRCNALAVKPDDDNTVLAGFAGGGIWKTTDGGTNWRPVFDENLELAIGDITYDPKNPNVVYAGTGDPNMPSIVFNGNGIYKSSDGGETWNYLGLDKQGIISKILIDPLNTNVLYAASMGNPYVRTLERGVYKSSDGGRNWQKVLFVSNQSGASDLVMAPGNPNILYASFWDRVRSSTESFVYGPSAKIYKSTDGGQNWTQMGGGLPTGKMGRTGLAISATNPDKVWAVYVDTLSRTGGIWKTTDGGQNWVKQNTNSLSEASADFGWYFGKIRLNPKNDEDIFFLGVLLWRRSLNSADQWSVAAGGHADSHDLVFTPSGRRYWANDGGVYRNNPNETYWEKCKNLPTTQFYRTDYNPTQPNLYFGGTQDNGINKGSTSSGLNLWQDVFSADGFSCAFNPSDTKQFWVETQNGAIHRTNDGGNNFTTGGTCLGTNDRCNWDTPFMMSRHNPNLFYAATYRAYFSTDASGWGVISPDLTDGVIYSERFHTASCFDESPMQEGRLYAGTSDGNVWWRNTAGTWKNISSGLPDRYVTSVHGSPHKIERIFVTHSGFRNNDETPHIHRSDNNGITWENISGDLPDMPVNDIFPVPGHADSVLCVAADLGVYFTRNGGKNWTRLGKDLPYVMVAELAHNLARRELVAATFGRSIWTFPLDSILSQKTKATVALSGSLKTEKGAGLDEAKLRNDLPTLSKADGSYLIDNQDGCSSIKLKPVLDRNPLNGVSTYDLVLISKHILGLESLPSPLKMIAADANKSNTITTLDIVVLRRLILGIDSTIANNSSWRFVPKNHVFPDPLNPFVAPFPDSLVVPTQTSNVANLDFWAIKVGDLNDDASPNFQAPPEDRSLPEWPLLYSSNPMADGHFELEIGASAGQAVGAQFALSFDAQLFDFEAIEPIAPSLGLEHFNLQRAAGGVLSFCFEKFDPSPYPTAAEGGYLPIFKLILKAKNKTNRPSPVLNLAQNPTRALAFRADGLPMMPVLARSEHAENATALFDLSPNPFGLEGTLLRYQAPTHSTSLAGQQLRLHIQDAQGKRIFQQTFFVENQSFNLKIEGKAFPASGQYFYQVVDKKGQLLKKGAIIFSM